MDLLVERVSERLDVTPVRARGFIKMREEYQSRVHLIAVLWPLIQRDAEVIMAMGWNERY